MNAGPRRTRTPRRVTTVPSGRGLCIPAPAGRSNPPIPIPKRTVPRPGPDTSRSPLRWAGDRSNPRCARRAARCRRWPAARQNQRIRRHTCGWPRESYPCGRRWFHDPSPTAATPVTHRGTRRRRLLSGRRRAGPSGGRPARPRPRGHIRAAQSNGPNPELKDRTVSETSLAARPGRHQASANLAA